MAEEFVNGFVHQNDIAVITRNPLKGDSGSMYRNTFTSGDFGSMPAKSKGGGEDRSGYGMELKEVDNF
ncbi:hypothetical protein JHK85_053403 [Glycine max]|nr:hypothetical protein JHK85_053403 [Glycine max]